MFNKISLALSVTLLLSACATSPTGRTQFAFMPDTQLNQMGLQAFDSLKRENPVSTNQRHVQFVNCVSDAIIREVGGKWEVVVFEDNSLNAFALPGNKIGVHSGMVKFVDNQDQLASIIGHEIGHVLARHSNERVSQQMAVSSGMALIQAVSAPQTAMGQTALGLLGVGAQYGVLLPYSRLHENEADKIGLDLMAKAGFDPRQSVTLWQKMARAGDGQQPPEFMSTHPAHATRIQELQNAIPRALEIQKQAVAQGKQPRCSK
ncbi:M48 family metallopeptidase [Methylotuvimicrobium alcaliphilum]|uniref:Peptidase M48 Ste24p n=1 Tax=Methylotuvimicrobium alcaliphilum (strain DSM 19304 / NCIMB 14124 / VKM B-2133 / 20Z) TaxID=1091494 RepID=G4SVH9_META2|nr:M48 family metallopeptidase [Methylotuvimicrobium alcaliphilum]CCE22951.1 Peptidase M48 Ste24p [Methylotuvimicrobium alcaliphilum 20Z]